MDHNRRPPHQRAGPTFNYHRAAAALSVAALYGDKTACKQHGIHPMTLSRYRARMRQDPKLLSMVADKKAILEQNWADQLAPAITEAVSFLQRAAKDGDPRDPDTIHAVAEALKTLFSMQVTKQLIDARLQERGILVQTSDDRTLELPPPGPRAN